MLVLLALLGSLAHAGDVYDLIFACQQGPSSCNCPRVLELVDDAIADSPGKGSWPMRWSKVSCLRRLGRPEEALQSVEEALGLGLEGRHLEHATQAQIELTVRLAATHLKRGSLDGAEAFLQRADGAIRSAVVVDAALHARYDELQGEVEAEKARMESLAAAERAAEAARRRRADRERRQAEERAAFEKKVEENQLLALELAEESTVGVGTERLARLGIPRDFGTKLWDSRRDKALESIRRLKDLLGRDGVNDETRATMMQRLAEQYLVVGELEWHEMIEHHDRMTHACTASEACESSLLVRDDEGPKTWFGNAGKINEAVLRNYPTHAHNDVVTFDIATAYRLVGRGADAHALLREFVVRYPKSRLVPDAYFEIGEYHYDKESAFGALKAYQKATQFPNSAKYPFATYKLAWCYHNVGNYERSISTMKAVVTYSMQSDTDDNQLEREALDDLVRFFVDADAMNEAYEYFYKLGKHDLIRSMLMRLAGAYFEQGEYERSIDTYRRLLLEYPQSRDNPEYQDAIIQAYRKIGQKEHTLEEMNRLLRDYGSNSVWARTNAADPNAVQEAERRIERNFRQVAVEYHIEARRLAKARDPMAAKVYQLARQAYATYLSDIRDSEHIYGLRWSYGELLYATKDFEGAFEQYSAVVRMDPKGKHSAHSAESAVLAAAEVVDRATGADRTTWEGKLRRACSTMKRNDTDRKSPPACQ